MEPLRSHHLSIFPATLPSALPRPDILRTVWVGKRNMPEVPARETFFTPESNKRFLQSFIPGLIYEPSALSVRAEGTLTDISKPLFLFHLFILFKVSCTTELFGQLVPLG